MTPAHAGEQVPEGVENASHRSLNRFEIVIVDVRGKHVALSGRMFAIGVDMDGEIAIMFRIGEAVMFLQPVDLRFADRGNLTLVCVKRGQTLACRSVTAN